MLLLPVPAMTLIRPRGGLHDLGDHPFVLFVRERRRFARGADGAEAIRAGGDLKLDLLAKQL